ncbi:hypothetical protein Scep_001822 [Stephania cephalantha]|uniref:Uncharacterized protein n=1 Tax=Stephania cephalantha TaxID=152367 RepID=A0AAP0Q853_9MAGN
MEERRKFSNEENDPMTSKELNEDSYEVPQEQCLLSWHLSFSLSWASRDGMEERRKFSNEENDPMTSKELNEDSYEIHIHPASGKPFLGHIQMRNTGTQGGEKSLGICKSKYHILVKFEPFPKLPPCLHMDRNLDLDALHIAPFAATTGISFAFFPLASKIFSSPGCLLPAHGFSSSSKG